MTRFKRMRPPSTSAKWCLRQVKCGGRRPLADKRRPVVATVHLTGRIAHWRSGESDQANRRLECGTTPREREIVTFVSIFLSPFRRRLSFIHISTLKRFRWRGNPLGMSLVYRVDRRIAATPILADLPAVRRCGNATALCCWARSSRAAGRLFQNEHDTQV